MPGPCGREPPAGRCGCRTTAACFTFVHRIDLSPRLTRMVEGSRGRPRVRVEAPRRARHQPRRGRRARLERRSRRRRSVAAASGASARRSRSSGRGPANPLAVRLPACGSPVRWRIAVPFRTGRGRGPRRATLVYRSPTQFRGTESIELKGRPRGATGSAAGALASSVQIKVEQAGEPVVRAIGDSITAGFGYYDDGTPMPFTSLLECEAAARPYDDACSSNSAARDSEGPDRRIRTRLRPLQQRLLGGAVGERARRLQLREPRRQRLRAVRLGAGRPALPDHQADRGRRTGLHPDDPRRQPAVLDAVRGQETRAARSSPTSSAGTASASKKPFAKRICAAISKASTPSWWTTPARRST